MVLGPWGADWQFHRSTREGISDYASGRVAARGGVWCLEQEFDFLSGRTGLEIALSSEQISRRNPSDSSQNH